MQTECIKAVVKFERCFQERDRIIARRRRGGHDDKGGVRLNEASRRRDAYKTRHSTGGGAQNAGFAARGPFDQRPDQSRSRCSDLGDQSGMGGQSVRRQRRAAVEAEPADPQQTGADDRQHHIVRRVAFVGKAATRPQLERKHQSGDAGTDMDHRAAGEIEHPGVSQEAAAPNPVRDGRINDQQPDRNEDHPGLKAHTFGHSSGDDRHRDDRKRHLEQNENGLRQARRLAVQRQTVEQQAVKAAEHARAAAAEGEGIARRDPDHRDQTRRSDRRHQSRQHILPTHHAAIEQGQTRQRHHHNQSTGGENPSDVTGREYWGFCLHRALL